MSLIKRLLGSIYGHLRSFYYQNRYNEYRKLYHIAESFGFNGTDIRLYGEGKIELGKESYMGSYSTIQSCTGCKVQIGEKCQISHNVRIYTSTAKADSNFLAEVKTKTGNVKIGNGVWIGANVFISPGITVEDNAVLGANSVITKNIEENCVVGGNPAVLIRKKKM